MSTELENYRLSFVSIANKILRFVKKFRAFFAKVNFDFSDEKTDFVCKSFKSIFNSLLIGSRVPPPPKKKLIRAAPDQNYC